MWKPFLEIKNPDYQSNKKRTIITDLGIKIMVFFTGYISFGRKIDGVSFSRRKAEGWGLRAEGLLSAVGFQLFECGGVCKPQNPKINAIPPLLINFFFFSFLILSRLSKWEMKNYCRTDVFHHRDYRNRFFKLLDRRIEENISDRDVRN